MFVFDVFLCFQRILVKVWVQKGNLKLILVYKYMKCLLLSLETDAVE